MPEARSGRSYVWMLETVNEARSKVLPVRQIKGCDRCDNDALGIRYLPGRVAEMNAWRLLIPSRP